VQEYGTHRQITDDIIIRLMRFACWIAKATDAHKEYLIFIAFPHNDIYANAPHCYFSTHIACIASS